MLPVVCFLLQGLIGRVCTSCSPASGLYSSSAGSFPKQWLEIKPRGCALTSVKHEHRKGSLWTRCAHCTVFSFQSILVLKLAYSFPDVQEKSRLHARLQAVKLISNYVQMFSTVFATYFLGVPIP